MEDVVTGQEFGRQPKNLPAMWLVDTVLIKVSLLSQSQGLLQPCVSGLNSHLRIVSGLCTVWNEVQHSSWIKDVYCCTVPYAK